MNGSRSESTEDSRLTDPGDRAWHLTSASRTPYDLGESAAIMTNAVITKKTARGFASMSPDKQRAIASMGGKAAHEKGTAHEWTREQAREAGCKGVNARRRRQAAA